MFSYIYMFENLLNLTLHKNDFLVLVTQFQTFQEEELAKLERKKELERHKAEIATELINRGASVKVEESKVKSNNSYKIIKSEL